MFENWQSTMPHALTHSRACVCVCPISNSRKTNQILWLAQTCLRNFVATLNRFPSHSGADQSTHRTTSNAQQQWTNERPVDFTFIAFTMWMERNTHAHIKFYMYSRWRRGPHFPSKWSDGVERRTFSVFFDKTNIHRNPSFECRSLFGHVVRRESQSNTRWLVNGVCARGCQLHRHFLGEYVFIWFT